MSGGHCQETVISVEKCFYLLKSIEREAEQLYSQISLNTSLKYLELSDLFQRLADEEETHVKKIEMCQQLNGQGCDAFMEMPEAMIGDFLAQVQMIRTELLRRFDQLRHWDFLIAASLFFHRDHS